MRRVVFGGAKLAVRFFVLGENDELEPDGKMIEREFNTLTDFAASAASWVRESWDALKTQVATGEIAVSPTGEGPTVQ